MTLSSLKTLRGILALALLAVFVCAGTARAQEITGTISGTVLDPSGSIVKGASVTLTNTDQNRIVRVVQTNGAGFYAAPSLPLGTYNISVTSKGFKTYAVTGLALHAKDSLTINGNLAVGSSEQSVTVTADAVQLNLTDATTSSLINGTQVRELELNTRNYEQLVALQPGVSYGGTVDQIYIGAVVPSGAVAVVSYSINGQRNSANNWTIDGADNVDRGSNLTLLSFPSIDAIAEFKTIRGTYSAQYGRAASGQIDVITRSGTNKFHGSLYEFFRNDVLNANTWINKNQLAGPSAFIARPKQRYNDFGGTFGGPVWIPHIYDGRDKTFFFFSEEIRRIHQFASTAPNVPTTAEQAGTMAAAVCIHVQTNGTCPVGDPGTATVTPTSNLAKAYIKDIFSKLPAPNGNLTTQDPHAYNFNQSLVYNNEQEFVRIDHAIGKKINIFYRYLHDSLPTQEPTGYGAPAGGGDPGVQNTVTHSPGTEQLAHVTYTISPTLLMNAGYAYSSGAILSRPAGTGSLANSPDVAGAVNLPYSNAGPGVVPNLSFTTFTGVQNGGIYNDYSRNHEFFGNFDKVWGKHDFIWGAALNFYNKTENSGSTAGTFTFTANKAMLPTATQALTGAALTLAIAEQSFANFLTGTATGGFSQQPLVLIPDLHMMQFEGFAQDNYKLTPRLTLNLGVRYSFFQQPHDNNGFLSNFDASRYVAANAPTIDSNGNICTANPCANAYGHINNGGTVNPATDLRNGLIYGAYNPTLQHLSQFQPRVSQADKLNFAPRIGFAWDVFGNGKTSLRGGFGIAYDSFLLGDVENNIFNNPTPQGLIASSYTFTNFDAPTSGSATAASTALPTIYSESPHFHTPYTEQYSLDMQHRFTSTLLLDVGYVGNQSHHLLGMADINSLPPGLAYADGFCGSGGGCSILNSTGEKPLNQIRPYLGYGGMYGIQTRYNSNYESLQVQVQKRFKGKSLVDVNYTWSHALTNNQSDRSNAPQNYYNIAGDYGRSSLDRKHILSADFVWELPWMKAQDSFVSYVLGGWELSGIFQANTGLPFTPTASGAGTDYYARTIYDNAGLGILGSSPAGLRPNQISNPNVGPKTKSAWFNILAFQTPLPTSSLPGNTKRGTINGPGFWYLNSALIRNFRMPWNSSLQFRAEGFNLFNHTNFASINVNTGALFSGSGAPVEGTVTAARDNRYMQLALKYTF